MRLCDIAMATRFLGQVAAKAGKARNRQQSLTVVRQLYKELYNVIVQQWSAMVVVIMRGLPPHLEQERKTLQATSDTLNAIYTKNQALFTDPAENVFKPETFEALITLTKELAEFLSTAFFQSVDILFNPVMTDTTLCVTEVKSVQQSAVQLDSTDTIIAAFQKATLSIARLGESISRTRASYPPLDSPLFSFLSETFDSLNVANNELANGVNAALRAIVAIPASDLSSLTPSQRQEKGIATPEIAQLVDIVTLIETFIEDVANHIQAERDVLKDVSPLNLYTSLAAHAVKADVLKEQLHTEKMEEIRNSGAAARVSRLMNDDHIILSPTVATLANNADSVGLHIQTISHNIQQRDIRSLRISADAARPSLGNYFKSLTDALTEEEAQLNRDVQASIQTSRAAVDSITQKSSPGDIRQAGITSRQALEAALERLAPVSTKRAFDGFSSPAFLKSVQAARTALNNLPTTSTPASSTLTHGVVSTNVQKIVEALSSALAEKLILLREHAKEPQQNAQLLDKVNAILQEPNNGDLEYELFQALDAIEEHVDGVISRTLPLSKSEETLVGDEPELVVTPPDLVGGAFSLAAPQAALAENIDSKSYNNTPTALGSSMSKSISATGLSTIAEDATAGFNNRRPSLENQAKSSTEKVVIQGSVKQIVSGIETLAQTTEKPLIVTGAAPNSLHKSASKSSVNSGLGASNLDLSAIGRQPGAAFFTELDVPQLERGPLGEDRVTLGTLAQLVKRLTDPNTIDILFTNAFIVTCSNFVTAERFMEKMIARYYNPSLPEDGDAGTEYEPEVKYAIQERVCIMIKKWIDENYDPEDPSMLRVRGQIFDFFDQVSTQRGNQNLLNMIKRSIEKKETALSLQKSGKAAAAAASGDEKPSNTMHSKPKWRSVAKLLGIESVLHSDDYDIAIQIAHANAELFKKIKPSEFRKLAWTKSDRNVKSINVLNLINYFNRTSVWVAASILKEKKLKRRVTTMSKMVSIGCFLRQLNDFQGVMSVLAGLSMASIKRLKWTFRLMPRKTIKRLEDMEKEMSSEKSYSVYRAAIAAAEGPKIPFLGVTLSDLTFIEEGNADYIDKNINFAKQMMFYDVITSIQSYQRHAIYTVEEARFPVAESIELANTEMSESGLYEYSLQIEPRNAKRKEIA